MDCVKSSFRAHSDVVIAIFTSAHVPLLGGACMGELHSQVTSFNEHHGMSFHKQNFPDVARQGQLMWPPQQMESLLMEPSLCVTEESFSVTGIKASRAGMVVPTFKWGRAQSDGVAYLRIYNNITCTTESVFSQRCLPSPETLGEGA